jgi:hypothetical protein
MQCLGNKVSMDHVSQAFICPDWALAERDTLGIECDKMSEIPSFSRDLYA